jgi:hypothetical protein
MKVNTRTIFHNASPNWSENFDILIYDERQEVNVAVKDMDFTGRIKTLGRSSTTLRVSELVAEGEKGVWLDLFPEGAKKVETLDTMAPTPQILLVGKLFELRVDPRLIEGYCSPSDQNDQSVALQIDGPKATGMDASPTLSDDQLGCFGFSPKVDCSPGPCMRSHTSEYHTGAACMLICEVFGGFVPAGLASPSELSLKFSLGAANDVQRCKAVENLEDAEAPLTHKMRQSIHKLATLGLPAEVIAQSLDEDVLDVSRIMRKSGWNLSCPQKLFLFLRSGDLCPKDASRSSEVHISVIRGAKGKGGKIIAAGSVPIEHILRANSSKYANVVNCSARDAVVAIDLQFRMYALSESIVTERHSFRQINSRVSHADEVVLL